MELKNKETHLEKIDLILARIRANGGPAGDTCELVFHMRQAGIGCEQLNIHEPAIREAIARFDGMVVQF